MKARGAAIYAGVWLSGKRAVLIMENSGLRVAVEPLSRIGMGSGIPVVMIMSYRGDLGEPNWWGIPHGLTMEPLLQALRIPFQVCRHAGEIESALQKAFVHAYTSKYHTALVLSGSGVE